MLQGLSGFGSVLLSIPLLAMFLDIKAVIPLAALAAVSITVVILVQLRHQFDWQKIYPLIVGAVPGIPVGVFFLKRLDREVIHWILGVILIVYSLYSLLSRSSPRITGRRWAYASGFLSGCFGGAFSAGGPPVIVYMSLQEWGKDEIKVSLQGYFLVAGLLIVFLHALSGITTFDVVRYFLVALPELILGTYLGSLVYGRIREESYRKVILVVLACLGCLMIYRG